MPITHNALCPSQDPIPAACTCPPGCVFRSSEMVEPCALPSVVRVWSTWEPALIPADVQHAQQHARPMCYSHGAMVAMAPAIQSDGGTMVLPL